MLDVETLFNGVLEVASEEKYLCAGLRLNKLPSSKYDIANSFVTF